MRRAAPRMPTRGTTPERRLEFALRALGAAEWERAPRDVPGSPDFFWRFAEVVVFVDGCQWHGCAEHFRPHAGDADAPVPHRLTEQGARLQRHKDGVQRRALQATGRTVLAFWEHEINRDAGKCAALVLSALEARERLRCR